MISMRRMVYSGLILAGVGWVGVAALMRFTLPELGPRWLFYFCFFLGVSGIALPIVGFLNLRYRTSPPPEASVVIRQSIWAGVYGCILEWLNSGESLTMPVAVVLAVGFILIEIFLYLRDRTHWKPGGDRDE